MSRVLFVLLVATFGIVAITQLVMIAQSTTGPSTFNVLVLTFSAVCIGITIAVKLNERRRRRQR